MHTTNELECYLDYISSEPTQPQLIFILPPTAAPSDGRALQAELPPTAAPPPRALARASSPALILRPAAMPSTLIRPRRRHELQLAHPLALVLHSAVPDAM